MLLVLFYRKQVDWRYRDVIAYTVIIAFLMFAIINFFYVQGIRNINSYTWSFVAICNILFAITYLLRDAQNISKEERIRMPTYWIVIAVLFYNSTTLYIVLWTDYLVTVLKSNLIAVWIIHNTLSVLSYTIIWYALYLIKTENTRNSIG